jgi:AcrR family transcriptional regulator
MGTKERRERERVDTRERILAAARDMFASEGYDSVTMRAIAERIEYTPTALYHHFDSKQALLTELCEREFAGLARHFVVAASTPDPIDRLRAVANAYLEFAENFPSQYRFMFMTVLPPLEPGTGMDEETMRSPEHNAYAFLHQACAEAIAQGRLRPEFNDPDLVAQICWATVHGLISLRITKRHADFVPWRELRASVQAATDAVINGMARKP